MLILFILPFIFSFNSIDVLEISVATISILVRFICAIILLFFFYIFTTSLSGDNENVFIIVIIAFFLTNYAACLVLSFAGEYRSELFGLNIFDEGIFGSDKSALNDDIFALSICSLILITAYAFFLPPNIYSLLILA